MIIIRKVVKGRFEKQRLETIKDLPALQKDPDHVEDGEATDHGALVDEKGEPVTFDMMPANINSDLLLGEVPRIKDRLLEREIDKLDYDKRWQPRRVILTNRRIVLTRIGEDSVIDSIPLYEIERVVMHKSTVSSGDMSSIQEPAKPKGVRTNGLGVVLGESRHQFDIFTFENGYNSGMTYNMSVTNEQDCAEILKTIEHLCHQDLRRVERANDGTLIRRMQRGVRRFYNMQAMQWLIASFIFANFVLNVVQAELQPADNSDLQAFFDRCDEFFTIIFSIEICINLFANWFWPFMTVST
jgi:hypothetical protein